ncbi:hypothetical protein BJ875DRAFT_448699 [Amylocarpus encephaloides]|uniref:Uncharacterized protein n=1 Tax=Amylocarpus encephaloides TaxID=45428 RepID=A0A9P7YSL2_9HELO|nr:hypothetical protein BJ875DRAFT_448699 [Amylocarpus encephaloides]
MPVVSLRPPYAVLSKVVLLYSTTVLQSRGWTARIVSVLTVGSGDHILVPNPWTLVRPIDSCANIFSALVFLACFNISSRSLESNPSSPPPVLTAVP